jgi:hypothetical protein
MICEGEHFELLWRIWYAYLAAIRFVREITDQISPDDRLENGSRSTQPQYRANVAA